ncbi:MAG: NAD-dependent malic enzyme, partial [Myxococcota bacterium]
MFRRIRDRKSGSEVWETQARGQQLLGVPLLNKGMAFTEDERIGLGLEGLLPPETMSIEKQAARIYQTFCACGSDIEKHIYLRDTQDRNEVLYYKVVSDHLQEMMPIIYTPVVGQACQRFSQIYRKPRGLFISYPNRDQIWRALENSPISWPEVIVVTDGERILGLGDQGAGGMGIPIGKLSLYVLCAGIHPATVLPIMLDAGTNNEERLADPLYLGWKHERITDSRYDDFVEMFVNAIWKKFPNALLQWEDFALKNANKLLMRYRNRLCSFNDDIQGTAATALSTILSAVRANGSTLGEQTIVILGAGSAGTGIADLIVQAMIAGGLTQQEALTRIWFVDRDGLLHTGQAHMMDFQLRFAHPLSRTEGWKLKNSSFISLGDVVEHVKPTILIGVSGQPGMFTGEIVKSMASTTARPIILPLSNPTSRAEASAADLVDWTGGRALVATGSPAFKVNCNGKDCHIAQCNNSYIFPGIGLGVVASESCRVTDSMFMAAAKALSELSPAIK